MAGRKLDASNTLKTIRQLIADLVAVAYDTAIMDAVNAKIAALNYAVAALQAVPDQTAKVAMLSTAVDTANAKLAALQAKQDGVKTYEGVTNAQGTYSVTFVPALPAVPLIIVQLISTNPRDVALVTRSAGSFSVTVQRRVDVLGLLPTYTNVAGTTVVVQIMQR